MRESGSQNNRTHNPCEESHWVSRLRENLMSGSYGEGLETGPASVEVPRQSFTRQVFFKMTKSYLRLAKEFQSRSYDALVAHTTIVFARYIMLALARRTTKDPRTLGTLFHAECDELMQTSFSEALGLLMTLLLQKLKSFAEDVSAPILGVLQEFMEQLPGIFRRSMLISTGKL